MIEVDQGVGLSRDRFYVPLGLLGRGNLAYSVGSGCTIAMDIVGFVG